MSRNIKAEFCVVTGRGNGQGERISHLVSRHVKAEFCVGKGGGGGRGGGGGATRGREYHT